MSRKYLATALALVVVASISAPLSIAAQTDVLARDGNRAIHDHLGSVLLEEALTLVELGASGPAVAGIENRRPDSWMLQDPDRGRLLNRLRNLDTEGQSTRVELESRGVVFSGVEIHVLGFLPEGAYADPASVDPRPYLRALDALERRAGPSGLAYSPVPPSRAFAVSRPPTGTTASPPTGGSGSRSSWLMFAVVTTAGAAVVVAEVARRSRRRRRHLERLVVAAELAFVDELTGVGNRRRLDVDLGPGPAECSGPVGFVMIDVDNFKDYNDDHGHSAGDEMLRQVARTISTSVRPGDTVYRYGGEEFCVLLPGAGDAEAERVAERIRTEVELRSGITVSLGVAVSAGPTEVHRSLADRADGALYAAKRNGRNRVVAAGRPAG